MYNNDINSKNYFGHALNLPESDNRIPLLRNQRDQYGIDGSELWSLDITIASFIYSRLLFAIEIEAYDKETMSEIKTFLPLIKLYKDGDTILMSVEKEEEFFKDFFTKFNNLLPKLWN